MGVDGEDATGLEVAVLVEDAVGGQVMLPVHVDQPAVVCDSSGIVDLSIFNVSVSHHCRQALGFRNHLVHGFHVVAKESGAKEQVFSGVASDSHFREGDNVGSGIASTVHKLQDPFNITGEVSDHGIHLSQGDSKGAHFSPTG